MLDRLVKISSLSGAFLIFCGVLKLIIFYNAFKINIVDFLNFSEIITSFLDDINLLIIFGIFMTFQSLLVFHFAKHRSKLSWENFLEQCLWAMYYGRKKYTWFFSILSAIILVLTLFKITPTYYFLIYMFAFSVIQLSTFVFIAKVNEKIEISDPAMSFAVAVTILSVVCLLGFKGIQEAKSQTASIEIDLNDSTITCNKENGMIYLGKTESDVFIYDVVKKRCNVIPSSDVRAYRFY